MDTLAPERVWTLSKNELLGLLESGRLSSRKITFYTPSFLFYRNSEQFHGDRFPTISVTGRTCPLNCKHCGGRVLSTMHSAETPEQLFALAERLKTNGAVGCLVSGGCLPDGSVPLEKFTRVLGKIKRELEMTVTVHTGIVSQETANALKDAGVDAALIDIVGCEATLKDVFNLKISVDRIEDSMRALSLAGLNFVPHVIVGLQEGALQGEFDALRMISHFRPSALVVIAFMPIRGTAMENVRPPSPIDIARVLASARVMFPATPLALGCMRPKTKHRIETDLLALKAGVDAIAFPSEQAVKYAENSGHGVAYSPYCCSQIYTNEASK
jgi:lipoyl synthase